MKIEKGHQSVPECDADLNLSKSLQKAINLQCEGSEPLLRGLLK